MTVDLAKVREACRRGAAIDGPDARELEAVLSAVEEALATRTGLGGACFYCRQEAAAARELHASESAICNELAGNVVDLMDRETEWQAASGLVGGTGDPGSVTPETLRRYVTGVDALVAAARLVVDRGVTTPEQMALAKALAELEVEFPEAG